MRIFLCGDLMLGRGIDQILASPVDPSLHEPDVRDAREKGIHYRMSPDGLTETLDAFDSAAIGRCGAGRTRAEAERYRPDLTAGYFVDVDEARAHVTRVLEAASPVGGVSCRAVDGPAIDCVAM